MSTQEIKLEDSYKTCQGNHQTAALRAKNIARQEALALSDSAGSVTIEAKGCSHQIAASYLDGIITRVEVLPLNDTKS